MAAAAESKNEDSSYDYESEEDDTKQNQQNDSPKHPQQFAVHEEIV